MLVPLYVRRSKPIRVERYALSDVQPIMIRNCSFIIALIFLLPWLGMGQSKGTWKYITIPKEHGYHLNCWTQVEVRKNNIYVLHGSQTDLLFSWSDDHGKTWQTETIETDEGYAEEGSRYKVTIEKLDEVTGKRSGEPVEGVIDTRKARLGSQDVSMKIDRQGRVHVLYLRTHHNIYSSTWLKYAQRSTSGTWTLKDVATRDGEGGAYIVPTIDLQLDQNENLHGIYIGRDLIYHVFSTDGKHWQENEIQEAKKYSGFSHNNGLALAIDKRNNLHLVVAPIEHPVQYFFSNDRGKTFRSETVVEAKGRSWFESDIAVDHQGQPHITYKTLNEGLWHATKNGLQWETKLINGGGVMSTHGQLLTDSEGGLHFSGHSSYLKNNQTRYAYSADKGQTWETEVAAKDCGKGCSNHYSAMTLSGERLYMVYKARDSLVGIAWKKIELNNPLEIEVPGLTYPGRDNPRDSLSTIPVLLGRLPNQKAVDSIRQRLQKFPMPEKLNNTEVVAADTVYLATDTAQLVFFDHGKADGDVVSVQLNGQWVLKKHRLSQKKRQIKIGLLKDRPNYLIVYSDSEGSIPPNTTTLLVKGVNDGAPFLIETSRSVSTALTFIYKPEE